MLMWDVLFKFELLDIIDGCFAEDLSEGLSCYWAVGVALCKLSYNKAGCG